jgi:hypothetical protein
MNHLQKVQKPLVRHVSGFLDKKISDTIYKYAKENSGSFSIFGNTEKEFLVHRSFEIEKNINEEISKIGNMVHNYISEEYSPKKFYPANSRENQIAKFEAGFGMHEHFDVNRPLDYATLVYLNDDYIGGEIYFPEIDISIKPKAGDLVCFPDNEEYVHGVRPITSGSRYTLPRWFTLIV